jgi:hypothetical protein
MERRIGLWIDRREALVVSLLPGGESIEQIESGIFGTMESQRGVPGDESHQRGLELQLSHFYDRVVDQVRRADLLVVLGPGAARNQFAARFRERYPSFAALSVEAAPRMTEPQLIGRVRRRISALADTLAATRTAPVELPQEFTSEYSPAGE